MRVPFGLFVFAGGVAVLTAALVFSWTLPPEKPPSCPELVLPATIAEDGCYRLSSDYEVELAARPAISIVGAVDVTLDLSGYTIRSHAPSIRSGIQAQGFASLDIRNGSIDGFLFGVRAASDVEASAVIIEGVQVSGGIRGLHITADDVIVSDNHVTQVTGHEIAPQAHSMGIEVRANTCTVQDNRIEEVYPLTTTEAVGISITGADTACHVFDNVIVNAHQPDYGRGIGFWLGTQVQPSQVAVINNRVEGYAYAFLSRDTVRGAYRMNTFQVDCGPDDVASYEGAIDANTFAGSGADCRDLIPVLRDLASTGSPNWEIRLGAALIEALVGPRDLEARCRQLAEASAILAPLADDRVEAQDQLDRMGSFLEQHCIN